MFGNSDLIHIQPSFSLYTQRDKSCWQNPVAPTHLGLKNPSVAGGEEASPIHPAHTSLRLPGWDDRRQINDRQEQELRMAPKRGPGVRRIPGILVFFLFLFSLMLVIDRVRAFIAYLCICTRWKFQKSRRTRKSLRSRSEGRR